MDDGAQYSGIGMVELSMIKELVTSGWHGDLDPWPASVADTSYWQYGNSDHSSKARPIIGSIVLQIQTNHNNIADIHHLVIKGHRSG